MTKTQIHKYLTITALAAAIALAGMLLVSLTNQGVTAQQFEIVTGVEQYASDMQAAEGPLRAILTLDNLFLVFYTGAFLFLAMAVKTDQNRIITFAALGALLLTAYLDLFENHHILTMLTSVSQGLSISLEEIQGRMVWSQLKFHSSYLGLFLFAFVLPDDTFLEKLLRWSLWVGYLPIGVLVYTYPDLLGGLLVLLRYLFMLAGFLMLAWNYYLRSRQ